MRLTIPDIISLICLKSNPICEMLDFISVTYIDARFHVNITLTCISKKCIDGGNLINKNHINRNTAQSKLKLHEQYLQESEK